MQLIKLTLGDTRPDPLFELRDKNTGVADDPDSWDKIDISAASTTVSVYIKKVGATTAAVAVPCTKVSTYSVKLPLASTPLTTVGEYYGQIALTLAGQTQRILGTIMFQVLAPV